MLSAQSQWPASAWTVLLSMRPSLNALVACLRVTNLCSWLAFSYDCSFETPAWRFPQPSGSLCVMLRLRVPHSSIFPCSLLTCHPAFSPCSAAALCWALQAGWQAAWSNPQLSYFCSVFTAPQPFSLLHVLSFFVCGWKTSEAFFLIKMSGWVNFDSPPLTSPPPASKIFSVLLLCHFFAHLMRLLLFCHLKIPM